MYNVVFVYTREAGGYEGCRTWREYSSKEEFEAFKAEWSDEQKRKKRVLEEGVSQERCLELVGETPLACIMASAVEEAKGPDGVVDPWRLEMELRNRQIALLFRG